MTLKSIIDLDNHSFPSGTPDMPITQAIEQMVEMGENAIVILSDDEKIVGIITDHDVMRALYKNQGKLEEMIVGDWMSVDVKTCPVSTKLAEAMKLMGRYKIRHLVVESDSRPVGIIGVRALLSKIHENDELELNVLRDIAVARRA